MLDGAPPRAVFVAHALGDLDLEVEGEPVGGAVGEQVHVAAHRPEEFVGLAEGLKFVVGENLQRGQFGNARDAVDVFRHPEQGLQVAQTAFALLDVRLDHVALATLLAVAGLAFGQLAVDEFLLGSLEELLPECAVQFFGEGGVAADPAVFKQGSADGEVFAAKAQAVLDGARRVADLQAQIPQHVERAFDDALGPGGDLVGGEEEEVDVGMGGHFGAAITADGDHRETFTGRGVW